MCEVVLVLKLKLGNIMIIIVIFFSMICHIITVSELSAYHVHIMINVSGDNHIVSF